MHLGGISMPERYVALSPIVFLSASGCLKPFVSSSGPNQGISLRCTWICFSVRKSLCNGMWLFYLWRHFQFLRFHHQAHLFGAWGLDDDARPAGLLVLLALSRSTLSHIYWFYRECFKDSCDSPSTIFHFVSWGRKVYTTILGKSITHVNAFSSTLRRSGISWSLIISTCMHHESNFGNGVSKESTFE